MRFRRSATTEYGAVVYAGQASGVEIPVKLSVRHRGDEPGVTASGRHVFRRRARNGGMTGAPLVMLALGSAVIAALASTAGAQDRGDMTVSLIQLIADSRSFDGKRVVVTGYVMLELDNAAVYLHETDAAYGISRNALWLDISLDGESQRAQFHRRYVLIEGIFSARRRGHLDAFSGSIERIGRFELVEPRPGPVVPAPH